MSYDLPVGTPDVVPGRYSRSSSPGGPRANAGARAFVFYPAAVRVLCILLLATGCGRAAFDRTDVPDAARNDSSTVDVFLPIDPIVFVPFGTPQVVAGVNSPSSYDDDPTLPDDALEMIVNGARAGGAGLEDVWSARRSTNAATFPAAVQITELSSAFEETCPELSPDGLRIYLTRNEGAGRDLYTATRADRDAPWGALLRLSELDVANEACGHESVDRLRLYFSSNRSGSDALYVAHRTTIFDPWGDVRRIELGGNASQHWLSPDERVLYFSRTAADNDIWLATRESIAEPFGEPLLVTELATTFDETDPWLTPDLRTIYFSSSRSGGGDIYSATR